MSLRMVLASWQTYLNCKCSLSVRRLLAPSCTQTNMLACTIETFKTSNVLFKITPITNSGDFEFYDFAFVYYYLQYVDVA